MICQISDYNPLKTLASRINSIRLSSWGSLRPSNNSYFIYRQFFGGIEFAYLKNCQMLSRDAEASFPENPLDLATRV
jgi:hypothetical protein